MAKLTHLQWIALEDWKHAGAYGATPYEVCAHGRVVTALVNRGFVCPRHIRVGWDRNTIMRITDAGQAALDSRE